MQEQLKQQLRGMVATLGKAEGILDSKSKKKDEDAISRLLEDMQNSALAIGNAIEEEVGLGTRTVRCLEEYCELLWQYLSAEELDTRLALGRELARKREEVSAGLEDELEGRTEVVFLLCRADSWSRMELLWEVARKNPGYDCRVLVPAGTTGGPAGAMDFDDYDMEQMKPNLVFLDGPVRPGEALGYDYAKLRELSDIIIYMPFYEDDSQVEEDCNLPQVWESDRVVVQSEKIKCMYVERLCGMDDGAEISKKVSCEYGNSRWI